MNASLLKRQIIVCVVFGLLSSCTAAPVVINERVSPRRHPNLAAAQTLIERAIERISDAQRVNNFHLGGHAARAKELLNEAYAEIKLAALASNANR